MIKALRKFAKNPAVYLTLAMSLVFSNLTAVVSPASATVWQNPWPAATQYDVPWLFLLPTDTTNPAAFNMAYRPQIQGGALNYTTSADADFQFVYSTFSTPYANCVTGVDSNNFTCGDLAVTVFQPNGNPYGVSVKTMYAAAADLGGITGPNSATAWASTVRVTLTSSAAANFGDVLVELRVNANAVNLPSVADRPKATGSSDTFEIGTSTYNTVTRSRLGAWNGQAWGFFLGRTLNWSPNLNLLLSASPATPSVAPTWSAGTGAFYYSKDSSSTSDCTVNSSTGVMTYSTLGTCVVKVTGQPDGTYGPVISTKTFNITLTPPAPTATFTAGAGSGTAPTVPSGPVASVPDSTGLIAPAGTAFNGWSCTPEGGSASAVAPGDSLPVTVNTTCVAQWAGIQVSFAAGSGSGSVPSTVNGVVASMPGQGSLVAPAGKFFDGWSCNPGGLVAEGASFTPTATTVCTAQWTGYAVSYLTGAGSGTAPSSTTGIVNSLPGQGSMTPPAGSSFDGWSCSPGGVKAAGSSLTPTGATVCTAQWTGIQVSFAAGSGSGSAPSTVNGVVASMPGQGSLVAPAGKFFDGWSCNPGGLVAEGASFTPTATSVCTAQWAGYAVSYVTGSGSGTAPSSTTGVVNSLPGVGSMVAPAGEAFNGWSCSPGGVKAAGSSLTPTGATVCTAQWTGIQVSFAAGSGSGSAPSTVNGVVASMPGQGSLVAPAGKFFDGWSCNPGGLVSEGASFTPTATTVCTAQWAGFGVSFTTGAGSGTAPSNTTGVVASMPGQGSMTAPLGQFFDGWLCSPGGSVLVGASFTPTADAVCVAQWTLTAPFSISFDKGAGSGVAPASVGGPQVLPGQGDMVAPAGKFFDGWLCAPGGLLAAGAEVTPTENMVCTAQWASFTVSFVVGSGSGSAPSSVEGVVASMPGQGAMVAPAGSYFAGWACPIEQFLLAGESFTPESDVTCEAIWWGYAVTFAAGSGSGSAPTSAEGVIDSLPGQGDMVAPAGKHFNGWLCTPGGVKAAGASLTPTASTNCVAVWVLDVVPTHKVVFKANGGSGSMANQVRSTAGKLGVNKFSRNGQKFVGWNTKADGSGVAYVDGAEFNFAADTTLYAQWWFRSKQLVTTFDGDQPTLKANMKSTIAAWLAKLPKGAAIVCLGSTSGAKVTAFDMRLAFNRANNVCQYAVKLRPDVSFVIKLNPSSDVVVGARHVWMYYNYGF